MMIKHFNMLSRFLKKGYVIHPNYLLTAHAQTHVRMMAIQPCNSYLLKEIFVQKRSQFERHPQKKSKFYVKTNVIYLQVLTTSIKEKKNKKKAAGQ